MYKVTLILTEILRPQTPIVSYLMAELGLEVKVCDRLTCVSHIEARMLELS